MKFSPSTAELQTVLERELSDYWGTPAKIARLLRRPSEYRTSFALEVLTIVLETGQQVDCIFKNLSWRALLEDAQQVKPRFLHNPRREPEIYRAVLQDAPPGTATCFGVYINEQLDKYWLFLEKVAGLELYQIGDFEQWLCVARWLAQLHDQFAGRREQLKERTALLVYDADFFRLWPQRATYFAKMSASPEQRSQHRALAWLAARYENVVAQLMALPTTLIHGEFYASNVLVKDERGSVRICPVDWEMAGIGPGLLDLAALTAGKWREEQRHALARAYYEASTNNRVGTWKDFLRSLDYCRLHLAMQWLGWSPKWKPPAENAHDWLGEALGLAERLAL